MSTSSRLRGADLRVKAADGATDIYGVLYRPRGFDPAQRYPVVDSVYPGPQVTRVAPCFHPGGMGLDAEPPPQLRGARRNRA